MKNLIPSFGLLILSALNVQIAHSQVDVRVVDVGAGLCVLAHDTVLDSFFLYDAGRWDNRICSDYVNSVVAGKDIELIVISHADSDHLGNLEQILTRNNAKHIIHTGYPRYRVESWRKANIAISNAARRGTTVYSLSSTSLGAIQSPVQVGNMSIELLYGLGDWSGEYLAENERRNAISIVVRMSAYGKSVFFSGDLVGRHDDDPMDTCSYSESELLSSGKNLNADVLIAPHHGANNASSSCFLRAVSPSYVIFSAGHKYQHPRQRTVNRIEHILGIPESSILRTDRGDDEGIKEWDYMRVDQCKDSPGDDDIDISITSSSELTVRYLNLEDESCE
ncbi:MBL fold metallo-hydrolase [Vibrio cholerae]|uniref:ComEC/Rec2 family competence protein n=1 Tax=Vibrio cholerae TaxID=666 RepID=UPI002F310AB8